MGACFWSKNALSNVKKVIQLDEFPIPSFWHPAPCQSTHHLHRPNDFTDEWRQIDKFLKNIYKRAKAKNILLTCEEPSAALIPYVSGYIDRQFNKSIDLYAPFRKSDLIMPVPFFSSMFGDLVTPYTDADEQDPAREPPSGWLKQHKLYAPQ